VVKIRLGGWRFLTKSDIRNPAEDLALARNLLDGAHGFAREGRRVFGDRKRLQTPWRLKPVFEAASRFNRIDTLKCRKAGDQSAFGHGGSGRSKHMRGGRKPNG
jgi:hypothetical protein